MGNMVVWPWSFALKVVSSITELEASGVYSAVILWTIGCSCVVNSMKLR
jgi:hypothetical protein